MAQQSNNFQSTKVAKSYINIFHPYFLTKVSSNVFILTGTHSHKHNPYNPSAHWEVHPDDEIAAANSLWCHGVPQSSLWLLPVHSLHVLWGKVSGWGCDFFFFFLLFLVCFFICPCSIEIKVRDFQEVGWSYLYLKITFWFLWIWKLKIQKYF